MNRFSTLTRAVSAVAIASIVLSAFLLIPRIAEATPVDYDYYKQITIYDETTTSDPDPSNWQISALVDVYYGQVGDNWQYEYHFVAKVGTIYQVGVSHDMYDPSIQPLNVVLLDDTGDVSIGRTSVSSSSVYLMRFNPRTIGVDQELQHFYIVYNDQVQDQNFAIWGCEGSTITHYDYNGVPEPGVLLLLGSGMVVLGALSRKRKS